jgi:hypothetical protein
MCHRGPLGIKTPSKYIAIPSLHTFGKHYNTIDILQYAFMYVETVLKPLYFTPLCLVTKYFSKLTWRLIILPKCLALTMTCILESKNEAYSMNPINLIG